MAVAGQLYFAVTTSTDFMDCNEHALDTAFGLYISMT
jgi:hypothetical protein